VRNWKIPPILAVALNVTAGAEAVRLSAEPFKIADRRFQRR
jgi:hypothetical protein